MTRPNEDELELARTLACPFFADGTKRVFVAACCKRVVVCVDRPTHCTTCSKSIEVVELTAGSGLTSPRDTRCPRSNPPRS